jgi:hypothetical protein
MSPSQSEPPIRPIRTPKPHQQLHPNLTPLSPLKLLILPHLLLHLDTHHLLTLLTLHLSLLDLLSPALGLEVDLVLSTVVVLINALGGLLLGRGLALGDLCGGAVDGGGVGGGGGGGGGGAVGHGFEFAFDYAEGEFC